MSTQQEPQAPSNIDSLSMELRPAQSQPQSLQEIIEATQALSMRLANAEAGCATLGARLDAATLDTRLIESRLDTIEASLASTKEMFDFHSDNLNARLEQLMRKTDQCVDDVEDVIRRASARFKSSGPQVEPIASQQARL